MLHNEKKHTGGMFGEVISGVVTQQNYPKIVALHNRVKGTFKRCSFQELPRPLDHIIIKRVRFSTYLNNANSNSNSNGNSNSSARSSINEKTAWKEFTRDCQIECAMHAMLAKNPMTRKYVPRYFFAGLEDDTFVMVMQHLPGKSLDAIMKRKNNGKIDRVTRPEFNSIKKALGEFHRAGFKHGDLHTGNIILDRSTGQVFFIDFATTHLSGTNYNGSMFVKNNVHMLAELEKYYVR